MEITIITKLIISLLIAIIIGIIAGVLIKKGNDAKVGLGCGLMFPLAGMTFIVLQLIIPNVIVIKNNNGYFTHTTKAMISPIKTSTGQSFSLSLCHNYIANFTDEPLVLYPEYYGPSNLNYDVTEEDPIIISPNSVVIIKHVPDYYFNIAPNQITSKSNRLETRWVIDVISNVIKQEGSVD